MTIGSILQYNCLRFKYVRPIFCKFVRQGSSGGNGKEKSYAATIHLPKTDFPLSMKGDVVIKRELDIQKKLDFAGLYSWQWKDRSKAKQFVLHDGPPYANGDPHVGHAVNKILKDITNRYYLLRGYRVHYKPGWDCHGLPIEQKALASTDHRNLDPIDIRNRAKKFAKAAITNQMTAFKRWGVMADWNNGCYYTLDPKYEARQLELFYQLYEKAKNKDSLSPMQYAALRSLYTKCLTLVSTIYDKYIYRDYMPTYWSPSSRTALAEAEIEYDEQYKSKAVYVKYPVSSLPSNLKSVAKDNEIFVIIWTTTPWTLPLNRAICYGSNIPYSLLEDNETKSVYIVASEFKEKLSSIMGKSLQKITSFSGSQLDGAKYISPALTGFMDGDLPLLPANHVTVAKGTGLVHTAPAHGVEDFQVAVKHKLPLNCYVDEDGYYTQELGEELKGKYVLEEGNRTGIDFYPFNPDEAQSFMLQMLRDWIVQCEDYIHSYPLDWRTKKPLILRASKQWFVNTSSIKQQALESLDGVKINPSTWSGGMLSQVTQRTYWCISRQRVWGVPIPVFYNTTTNEPLISSTSGRMHIQAIIEHLKKVVEEKGTDCWWSCGVEELLPVKLIEQSGGDTKAQYEKGRDVLDIWFDSGASWFTVLNDCGNTADVYLEGIDQFGGWFQSSLLTSVAATGKAPYSQLLVHGFTVDEEGRKMSKSIGNVIDPNVIINGGKDKKIEPAYGVDVLRLWVAQSGGDAKLYIGPTVLSGLNERLFKLRKSLRYVMSNLYDFNINNHQMSYTSLLPIDQFILHQLYTLYHQVISSYEEFNYRRAFGNLELFINVYLSGLHAHVTKDRMYCGSLSERRSAQYAQYAVLDYITKLCAPVVPHLAEEICLHTPLNQVYESVFKSVLVPPPLEWNNDDLCNKFSLLLTLRDEFNSYLSTDRPADYDVNISFHDQNLYNTVKDFHSDSFTDHSSLLEILQCAHLSIQHDSSTTGVNNDLRNFRNNSDLSSSEADCSVDCVSDQYRLSIKRTSGHQCPRCRRNTGDKDKHLCEKCHHVLLNAEQQQQHEQLQ